MSDTQTTIKTITAAQLEDPLAFDMSKVLVFKMPTITSKKMYDHVDSENPNISFKESVYYQEKRHLGGMMSQKSLRQLKNKIRVEMGEHRRDVYDLSPDPAKRTN